MGENKGKSNLDEILNLLKRLQELHDDEKTRDAKAMEKIIQENEIYQVIRDNKTEECKVKLREKFTKEEVRETERLSEVGSTSPLRFALVSINNFFAAETLLLDFDCDLMSKEGNGDVIPTLIAFFVNHGSSVAERFCGMCKTQSLIDYKDAQNSNVFVVLLIVSMQNERDPSRLMERLFDLFIDRGMKSTLHRMLKRGSNKGTTPLMIAAGFKYSRPLDLILREIGDDKEALNFADHEGDTAMHFAVYKESYQNVATLLDSGANPYQENHRGMAPAFASCFLKENKDVTETLKVHMAFKAYLDALSARQPEEESELTTQKYHGYLSSLGVALSKKEEH